MEMCIHMKTFALMVIINKLQGSRKGHYQPSDKIAVSTQMAMVAEVEVTYGPNNTDCCLSWPV